jgi:TPR repeat protein
MERELDLRAHLHDIEDAGDDLAALFTAGSAAAVALTFRATDAMIGLDPVDQALIEDATVKVVAALRRCAEAGEPRAWTMIAEAIAHLHPEGALEWWEAGAAGGDVFAARQLVTNLWPRRDREALARARPFLLRAALAGDSCGLEERFLGWMAFQGIGGDKDVAASRQWQLAGAAKGDADAMFELYALTATGQGCEADEVAALEWCRRAAEAGSARAMTNLGGFYATGRGVPLDEALAVSWYTRAAEAGSGRAAATLGVMTAEGQGVPADRDAAVRWFAQAEALGYPWWEMCEAAGLDPDEFVDEE